MSSPHDIIVARLDGDKPKFGPNDNNPLRRVSADWQSYQVIQEQRD